MIENFRAVFITTPERLEEHNYEVQLHFVLLNSVINV